MTGDDALEQLLVLRAQLGARDAYARLVERHDARLLFFLRRIVGRTADAEDVRQKVWLTVVRKLGTLEHPAAFRTWLYRIARHQAISWLRSRRIEVTLDETDLGDAAEPEDTDDELGLAAEDAAAIYAALDTLSPRHREMLALRYLGGLRYDEIARVLDCPVGTVRSRIHYARAALRAALAPTQRRDVP